MRPKPRLLSQRPQITPIFSATAIIGLCLFLIALGIAAHHLGGFWSLKGLANGLVYITSATDLEKKIEPDQGRLILGLRGLAPIIAATGLIVPWLIGLYRQLRWQDFENGQTIICGLGWQGRAYAYNANCLGRRVCAIEIKIDAAIREFCRENDIYMIEGAADLTRTLEKAGIRSAREVFICTGNQDLNLEVARQIKQIVGGRQATLSVHVSMGAGLADATSSDETFADLIRSDERCHFDFYDPEERMARMFFYQYPVYRWAEDQYRPQHLPVRVHLVFLGFNRLAGELILQYSRIWPCRQHHLPRFTIIATDTDRAERFIARHKNAFRVLPEHINSTNPSTISTADETRTVAEIRTVSVKPNHIRLLQDEQITTLSDIPVTAIISCDDDPEVNIQRATHARTVCRKLDSWHVPILVHVDKREGTDSLLEFSQTQISPSDRILPFGSAADYCDLELLQYIDEWAQTIHLSYRNVAEKLDPELPANKPWGQLRHYDHASNYRAADHVPLKLYTIGYQWHSTCPWPVCRLNEIFMRKRKRKQLFSAPENKTPHTNVPLDEHIPVFTLKDIVHLSKLEHRSWLNEHLLKGFVLGIHDKSIHKTHPDLVGWQQLSKTDKHKDNNQIISIALKLASTRNVVNAALPIRIVVSAEQHISQGDSTHLSHAVKHLFKQDKFNRLLRNRWVELVSPLLFNAEVFLTKTLLDELKEQNHDAGLQLNVRGISLVQPGTVPLPYIEDVHRTDFDASQTSAPADDDVWWPLQRDKTTFKHYKYLLGENRQHILGAVQKHQRIRLYNDGAEPKVWTDAQHAQLSALCGTDGFPAISTYLRSPRGNLSAATRQSHEWTARYGDALISCAPPSKRDPTSWDTNKPTYRYDTDNITFQSNQG